MLQTMLALHQHARWSISLSKYYNWRAPDERLCQQQNVRQRRWRTSGKLRRIGCLHESDADKMSQQSNAYPATGSHKVTKSRPDVPVQVEAKKLRELLAGMAASLVILSTSEMFCAVPPAHALEVASSRETFERTCSGCHAGGGNILQPGSGLTLGDLQRNGVDTEEAIYAITYFGKGRMPGYGEGCKPRGQCTFGPRLSEEAIHSLAAFVLEQAEQGWATQ